MNEIDREARQTGINRRRFGPPNTLVRAPGGTRGRPASTAAAILDTLHADSWTTYPALCEALSSYTESAISSAVLRLRRKGLIENHLPTNQNRPAEYRLTRIGKQLTR